jgi:hypothetical protein
MCPIDSNAQNAVISKGVIRTLASSAGVILSRNISQEARNQAQVKLLGVKNQIRTKWCGTCGGFTGLVNGTELCSKCNTRLAKENEARNENSK